MGVDTAIEWADHTANFWEGCTQISPACDFCYAKTRAERYGTVEWNGPPRKVEAGAKVVRAAQRMAVETGQKQFVFVNSLSDFFDNQADPTWRLWAVHEMMRATDCIFLLLTKRIGNVVDMFGEVAAEWPPNFWLGITVPNQPEADRDIPKLLRAKAALRIPRVFLSIEPMLGPVDVSAYLDRSYECGTSCGWRSRIGPVEDICNWCGSVETLSNEFCGGCGRQDFSPKCPSCGDKCVFQHPDTPVVDWVICGGESGKHARPMHPAWARSLRDQCANAGVPFMFKQWGEWGPVPGVASGFSEAPKLVSPDVIQIDREYISKRGKPRTGRLLDGAEHNGRPQP